MPVPVEQTEPIKVANLSPMLLAKIRLMISDERSEIEKQGDEYTSEYVQIFHSGSEKPVIGLEFSRTGDENRGTDPYFKLTVHNGTTGENVVYLEKTKTLADSTHLYDLFLLMKREYDRRDRERKEQKTKESKQKMMNAQVAAEKYLDSLLSR